MSETPATFRDGRYRIVGVLGEGAQATTFDAVDAKVGQAVAVKRFQVRGAKSWKEVELAEREARVLSGLSHPLLPRYVEHFEEGGELFLVTEKIEGESLLGLRKRGVTLGEGEVRRLLRDAADALAYLHGRAPPIVHRDLKPGNVIRRPDGSFAFIDFGAVRDRMKPEGGSTVVGTFGYMAPEQFQGRAMPASDVYAVGATALSLLTGREPEDLPHRGLRLDVAAALAGSRVSPELVEALSAMLEPDPDRRAPEIAPLLAELDAPEPAPVEAPPAPGPPPLWPYFLWMIGVIAASAWVLRAGFPYLRLGPLGLLAVMLLICFRLYTRPPEETAPRLPGRKKRALTRARRARRPRIDVGADAPTAEPVEDEDDAGVARRTRRL